MWQNSSCGITRSPSILMSSTLDRYGFNAGKIFWIMTLSDIKRKGYVSFLKCKKFETDKD